MLSIRNISKGLKSSHVWALQYRRFRTSAYLTSTSNEKAIKARQKFKLKQAKMQRDDGVPIYLKCGIRDKFLFNLTLAATICNAIHAVIVIIKLNSIW